MNKIYSGRFFYEKITDKMHSRKRARACRQHFDYLSVCVEYGGGSGKKFDFNEITTLNTFDGANKAFYMVAGISYIIILILTSVMVILGALGLIGGIFDIKGLNMTTANRSLSIISLILSALAMGMMITYVALLDVTAMIGAGVITTFLLAIVAVVGAFVAQSRKIYRV